MPEQAVGKAEFWEPGELTVTKGSSDANNSAKPSKTPTTPSRAAAVTPSPPFRTEACLLPPTWQALALTEEEG